VKRRQAVILAGGMGTRLRASTGELPKPLVPVGGKPFLRWLVELLRDRGMTQALLLTGHRAELIHEHFARHPVDGIEVAWSQELSPLGTGGAVRQAAPLLDERFVLVNGDTYLDVDYAALLAQAAPEGALATMVVYLATGAARGEHGERGALDQPGNVEVGEDGFLTAYRKSAAGAPLPYIDAGVAVWSREVFDRQFAQTGACSLEADVFPALIARRQLWSQESPTRFYDIGTPERLAAFEAAAARGASSERRISDSISTARTPQLRQKP